MKSKQSIINVNLINYKWKMSKFFRTATTYLHICHQPIIYIGKTFASTFNNYRRTASSSVLLAWQGTLFTTWLHFSALWLVCTWSHTDPITCLHIKRTLVRELTTTLAKLLDINVDLKCNTISPFRFKLLKIIQSKVNFFAKKHRRMNVNIGFHTCFGGG